MPSVAMVKAVVDYSGADLESNSYCRMLAGQLYINSDAALSVRDVHQRPEFQKCSYRALERWCGLDRWSERRQEVQERVRKRVESSMATELARARIDQLRRLLEIREKFNAVGMLTNDKGEIQFKMEPKSLEGWMAVLLKLDAHIDKLQGSVAAIMPSQTAEAVVPMDRGSGLSTTLKPRLTEEESLELALKLRDMRMQQDNAEVTKFQAEQRATQEAKALSSPEAPKKKKPPT